ncbi:zinc finger protein [Penicillium chermesinum]|nr:zinc finger protein [Penicillium chermesinum]
MTANIYNQPSKLIPLRTFNAFPAPGPLSPPSEDGSPKLPYTAWARSPLSMNMESSPHLGHSSGLPDLNTQDPYLSVSSDPEEQEFQANAIRLTPVGGSPTPGYSPHDGSDLSGPGPTIQTQLWAPGNEYSTTSSYTSPSNASGFLVPSEIDLSNNPGWSDGCPAPFGTGTSAPTQQWPSADVGASHWLDPEQAMPGPASVQNEAPAPNRATMQGSLVGANTDYKPPCLTVSTEPAPVNDLGSASTARGRSPIVMVESVSRGDSPDREYTSHGRRLSRSTNHLSPGDMQDYDDSDGELEDDHRNGKWIRNATTGLGGLDPSSRGEEYVASPNELKGQREREQKNEEIGAWLSKAIGQVDNDEPRKRTLKPSSRVRARSTGDRPLQQEDYFNLQFHTNGVPGPGVLVHESEGSDDDDASVGSEDIGSDTSPADANDPARYDRSTPEIYSSLERSNSENTTCLYPWHDAPRDPTPRMEAMQPGSSSAAMAAFERRARDIETASLAATIDNNSIINRSGAASLRGSFFQASQRIKRQASDLSTSTINTANQPPPVKSPVAKESSHRRRISLTPRQHSRSPSLSSALLSMSGQIAAIGGNNAVHAVSPNAESNAKGAFTRDFKARGRSRSELPRPVTPGLADLMTNHGGPPVASIYRSPNLEVNTKQMRPGIGPETDTAGADDDDDDQMDTADSRGLVMDFPPVSSLPVPTLEGFKAQIMHLNPRLEPVLINRFANEQIRRYKKLVELQQKHIAAVSDGKCGAGQFCFALGGKETLLDQRKTSASSESGQTQFRVSDFSNGREQAFASGEGSFPATHAAQFPAGVPLPPVSHLPAQFECTICFEVKKFQKPSDWSKHVQEDIQPFTCSFPQCNEPKSFKRKADWVRHENELHRQLEWWTCSYADCNHTCFRKDNFVQHLVREHKLPDPKVKRSRGAGATEQDMARLAKLLEDCRHETDRTADSEPCRFCGNICGNWKKLTVHLGKHMEQLAMPVLELAKQSTASPAPATVAGSPSGLPLAQSQFPATDPHAPINPNLSYETPMFGYSISGTALSQEPESMDSFKQADQFPGYGMTQFDENSLHPHLPRQPIHMNSVTYPPPYNSVHRPRTSETNVPLMHPSYPQFPSQASSLYPADAGYPAYQAPGAPDSSYSSAHYNSSYSSQM